MVNQIMDYKVISCGCTDPGRSRSNNEDVWLEEPERHIFAIADGMGGHRAGEVAAREAVRALFAYIKSHGNKEALDRLSLQQATDLIRQAIAVANSEIFRLGRSQEQYKGMGTTLCCLYFHPQGVISAHVGDSRIYRLHRGRLSQITHDHSLLRELLDLGQISERQAPDFQYRNIITRAIGTESSVEASLNTISPCAGDLYLMSTDGLTDLVKLNEIETIINRGPNIRESVKSLIKTANERGGFDNITAVLIQIQSQRT